jgi:hypothetical protein
MKLNLPKATASGHRHVAQESRVGQHVLTTWSSTFPAWLSSLGARSNELGFSMPFISKTPKPPYYAVIFTSINADVDHVEHTEMYRETLNSIATMKVASMI